MTNAAPASFVRALEQLPLGTFNAHLGSRRYIASKTAFNSGRSIKLVAEALGGGDYISLNLFHLTSGSRVYPCEMSRAKVIAFVENILPDQS
ncbi:MAG: hypothetical protein AB8B62_18420 [Roseobacter sp.]